MKYLIKKVNEILLSNPSAVIAVDGMCASGKTTFAKQLEDELGFQVIHMDDFFLPPDMRTDERLSMPGGNVHYERFFKEVSIPLKNGRDSEYRIFDCSVGNYTEKRKVVNGKPLVIEGAYSTHPEIPDIYDLKIFFEISTELQLERIENRNGVQALEIFKEKWIPLENRYFKTFSIKEKCDIAVEVKNEYSKINSCFD